MTTQETVQIKAGDTLVNDDGTVTISVDAIEGDMADVTDSRSFHDDGEVEVGRISEAVKKGNLSIIRDSGLTDIKGVGEATAPKLEAKTGCGSPDELFGAFLRGEMDVDLLPRTDYFKEWAVDNLDTLDVDVDPDLVRVFLFLKEHGGSVTDYYDGAPTHPGRSIKKSELSIDHIQWESQGYWPDSSSVMGVGTDEWLHHIGLDTDLYVPVDSIERDGNYYRADADGGETWLSADYVESAIEYFGIGLDSAIAHPDGEFPVVWDVEDSPLSVAIAPQIR